MANSSHTRHSCIAGADRNHCKRCRASRCCRAPADRKYTPTQGSRLDHGEYETFKQTLGELLLERGYFDYQFVHKQLRVDPGKHVASIELVVDSGPRYRFGEITLPDKVLAADLLVRYFNFKTGDPYLRNPSSLSRAGLNDSQYFSEVSVTVAKDTAVKFQVPVQVQLQLRKQYRYTIGVGASTDIGPHLRLGLQIAMSMPRGTNSPPIACSRQ